MTEHHTSINGLIQSVAAEALRPGTPDEIVLDMSELLAWHGTHCSKCGRLLSQQSIDYGRCMIFGCLTMLVGVTEENVLELHVEAVRSLGWEYWVNPLRNPEKSYPGLNWRESGLRRLGEVLEAFDAKNHPEHMHAQLAGILEELQQKLKYLSDYGGENWEVSLRSDGAPMSFTLDWMLKVGNDWRAQFNGCLQCDAVAQPFGSVVLGEPSYWSIHT